jgi:hypothetical protein
MLTEADISTEYSLVLRRAANATATGADCHGRPTASDYYAAAEPPPEFGGAHAYGMTSRGRVYVFFDGLAPRESDMARDGLAVPLDALETFRIP